MNILVLGASGLLGNAIFRVMSRLPHGRVYGTVRSAKVLQYFEPALAQHLIVVGNIEDSAERERLFDLVSPKLVVNCISVGRPAPEDCVKLFTVLSVLPRRLSLLCSLRGARLIHISSDGVFSGKKGAYTEDDLPDANDVYGLSKLLGEVSEPHAITLRTSIIGRELEGKSGLLEWFLSRQDECKCYSRVIFSGFPACVLAEVVRDIIVPRPELHGIFHLATQPISKFDLLQLVAKRYGKSIKLIPDDSVVLDRSLVADRFSRETGYVAPAWSILIEEMYADRSGLAGM
jgi:dTDP-4-dehydrorhamnose reductase